jgi:hypothetical protein
MHAYALLMVASHPLQADKRDNCVTCGGSACRYKDIKKPKWNPPVSILARDCVGVLANLTEVDLHMHAGSLP